MLINDVLVENECEAYSVSAQHTVRDALKIMTEHNVDSVLVMDNNQLEGILTKRNILSGLGNEGDVISLCQVADIMSAKVISCAPEDSVEYALHVMNRNHIYHLPVIDKEKVCGMVSKEDVLNASINAYQFENRLLKRYIQTWPEEQRSGGLKLVVNNKFRQPAENSEALA
jgi:CBS-domain-containing membrane protein